MMSGRGVGYVQLMINSARMQVTLVVCAVSAALALLVSTGSALVAAGALTAAMAVGAWIEVARPVSDMRGEDRIAVAVAFTFLAAGCFTGIEILLLPGFIALVFAAIGLQTR